MIKQQLRSKKSEWMGLEIIFFDTIKELYEQLNKIIDELSENKKFNISWREIERGYDCKDKKNPSDKKNYRIYEFRKVHENIKDKFPSGHEEITIVNMITSLERMNAEELVFRIPLASSEIPLRLRFIPESIATFVDSLIKFEKDTVFKWIDKSEFKEGLKFINE